MRIAIIGGGIAGLTVAYLLNRRYDITLFDSGTELGGHTATKHIHHDGQNYALDTGFIVYNDWTYPNFIKLLDEIGVTSKPTEMGFSVFTEDGSFYYSGASLNTLFAKRRLLFSRKHWQLIRDILRFNRDAVADWQGGRIPPDLSLGEYLLRNQYSGGFRDHYLVPMGSAIWSSAQTKVMDFSAKFFVEFFHNHGLLSVAKRPVWRVIEGGSESYIEPLTRSYAAKVHKNAAVRKVLRKPKTVEVVTDLGSREFDHVVFACHSDQALRLLADPSLLERELLSAIPFQENSVTLHTDETWLPKSKRAWASWNYLLSADPSKAPVVTYNMNILQGLHADTTFCVTLNEDERIDQRKICGRYSYAHPVFSTKSVAAQARWPEINTDKISYCGAYWFNGFHEDGVRSAIRVAEKLGVPF